ncbi:MAG: hypothetical protein ACKO9S_08305 [Bacteroidota bacterium]
MMRKLVVAGCIGSVVLIWFAVVIKLGVGGATTHERPGIFPATFNWWEETAWDQHLFLGQYKSSNVSQGFAYTSNTYPILLTNYIILYPFHHLFDIRYELLQNGLVYLHVLLLLGLIIWLRKKEISELISPNLFGLCWLFLVLGLVLSNALPWISFLRYNADNFHFFVSIVFCFLSVNVETSDSDLRDRRFLLGGLVLACISVIYIIPWALCYIFSEEKLVIRTRVLKNMFLVLVIAGVNYFLPILAQEHLGLVNVSSGFLYRSGLDGHSIYLKSTFSPYFSAIAEQHIGNCISLMCGVFILIAVMKVQRNMMLKQLLFNLIPFAFVYIVFPQMCTIHPYLSEFLFVTPCIFLIAYWLTSLKVKTDFSPSKFVYAVLFLGFLIVGQLMEIAKIFVLDNIKI